MSVILIWLLFAINFNSIHGTTRTFKYAVNNNCEDLCKDGKIILSHVQAIGPNDTIHYVWDFSQKPTVFLALTSSDTKLVVDWKKYSKREKKSVKFSNKPLYSFGIVINRIFEFNDVNDDAKINKVTDQNIVELNPSYFKWKHGNWSEDNNVVKLEIEADSYFNVHNNDSRNGSLKILMNGFGSLNHSLISPHMLHSENSTQFDLVLNNLDTFKNFTSSRFALELLIVSENSANSSLVPTPSTKLDDEFTPGIFEVMKISTPAISNSSNLAYVQWRPVSYLSTHREVTDSTEIYSYKLDQATNNTRNSTDSFLHIYYGDRMLTNLVQKMNISLGDEGDGFYKNTRYSTWTFLVGYGTVPSERLSNSMITVIAAIVMAPFVLLASSIIYIYYKNTEIPHSVLE